MNTITVKGGNTIELIDFISQQVDSNNGIRVPNLRTTAHDAWSALLMFCQAEGREPEFKDIGHIAAHYHTGNRYLNPSTVTTQLSQWRKFQGIQRERIGKPNPKPKANHNPSSGSPPELTEGDVFKILDRFVEENRTSPTLADLRKLVEGMPRACYLNDAFIKWSHL